MADVSREEKLAAARKKLKQFNQKKSGKGRKNRSETVIENNHEQVSNPNKEVIDRISTVNDDDVKKKNRQNRSTTNSTLDGEMHALIKSGQNGPIVNGECDSDDYKEGRTIMLNKENRVPIFDPNLALRNDTGAALDDVVHNNNIHNSAGNRSMTSSNDSTRNMLSHSKIEESQFSDTALVNSNLDKGSSASPTQSKKYSPTASRVRSPFENLGRTTPSIEGMQQLSRQINGLLSQSESYMNGVEPDFNSSIADLETRNVDLAAQLEKNHKANHQLSFNFEELKGHNMKLQEQLMQERRQFEEQMRKEIGALKEQLQVHIQTIGILVAEKSELQSSLAQSYKSAEQRLDELEILTGRLKASRQRVADLEKSCASAGQSSKKHEKTSKELGKDVDRLKVEIYKSSKSSEELRQQNSELQEKLNSKVSECLSLNQNVNDIKHALDMKEVLIQQLSNQHANADESSQMVQLLNAEKVELSNRLEKYNEAFQKVTAERDHIAEHYKQYIDQLKQQEVQLQEQVDSLTDERDRLVKRMEDLEVVIAKLNFEITNNNTTPGEDLQTLVHEISGQLQKVKLDYEELTMKYQAQIQDNSQLSRLVVEREEKLLELESRVEKMNENSADHNQLLENLQNDKMALSRAMTQNKELKTQLGELQNGFVKMSHENMDLMSQLQGEQHVSKELGSRLGHQEDELKDIREQLTRKEIQLNNLHAEQTHHNKQLFHAEQLEDRIRHFEAQGQLVDTLQRELNSAQDTINALTSQNTELKSLLQHANEAQIHSLSDSHGKRAEMVDALSASVRQLEMERNEVLNQCREETKIRQALQAEVELLTKEKEKYTPSMLNGTQVTKDQFDAMQSAKHLLEDKYTKVMRDKADLDDQREQYEYIIMQLQNETDTIGDYISLYHQQRGVLQHREMQKEEYIVRLTRDREDMQGKLTELQGLVMKLLDERNQLRQHSNNNEMLAPLDNHIPPTMAAGENDNTFGKNLNSSKLDDWPDYMSDTDSDSDVSEVEAIIATQGEPVSLSDNNSTLQDTREKMDYKNHHHHNHHSEKPFGNNSTTRNIPENNTAQKIMHLLTEIGNTTTVDDTINEELRVVPCKCCQGRLQIV